MVWCLPSQSFSSSSNYHHHLDMQSFVDSLFVHPVLLLLLLFPIANAATFNLLDDFSGETFFEKWDFYGTYDNLTLGSSHVYSFSFVLTIVFSGDVNWLDRNTATSKKLVYVNPNGNAVMKVSMEPVVYNNKRDSVSFWRLSENHCQTRVYDRFVLQPKGHTQPEQSG